MIETSGQSLFPRSILVFHSLRIANRSMYKSRRIVRYEEKITAKEITSGAKYVFDIDFSSSSSPPFFLFLRNHECNNGIKPIPVPVCVAYTIISHGTRLLCRH